jgi:hypothetical protein
MSRDEVTRPRLRSFLAAATAAAATLGAAQANAQSAAEAAAGASSPTSSERAKDQPSEGLGQEKVPAGDKDPIRGSTFTFDQSMTTTTAHVGMVSPQSEVPFYQWWLSLRPRWNFSDKLRVQARMDLYKEFTNSQDTTYRNEDVFGDIWTDLIYSTPLATNGPWKDTKASAGVRAIWPVSKASRGEGIYATVGATSGVSQKFVLRGADAPFLNSARVGLSFTYLHPFSDSTTPNSPNFIYTRMDTELRSFPSNQLSGQTLAAHTLYGILDTGLDITPKLSATLDFIVINQWHYPPTSACTYITTGPVCPLRINDQQYVQQTWLLLEADYQILPEISLGLGYYNLANTIAPDGTVRTLFSGGDHSLLWSPDARFYFDVTANLDKIFEAVTGKYKAPPGTSGPSSRIARQ